VHPRVEAFLAAHQAVYRTLPLGGAVTAQEQAAATGTPGWAMAKVLLVKVPDGYVMAVVPAAAVLDLARFRGLLGAGSVRLATVEEVGTVIPDCVPGAIPPFGALWGLRVFVDRALLRVREVTMPGGDLDTALRMRVDEFLRLTRPRIGDFAVPAALAPSLHLAGGH
jgi:Ala-tRNA(Pro) deacylase